MKACPVNATISSLASDTTWCNSNSNVNVTQCNLNCNQTSLMAASLDYTTNSADQAKLTAPSVMCHYQTTTFADMFCIPVFDSLYSSANSAQSQASQQIQSQLNSFLNTEQV